MDSEAAVIRSEMSRTRAELDRKLTLLEERARELTPRRYWERHKPDFFLDRALGGMLTLIGLKMTVGSVRRIRRNRRDERMRRIATRMAVL
jgi:hypothetical protein